ncbi:MAG: FAD-dependent monooxygenase [Thermoleophilaceae bacterium]|nr:FAD-dependent monooxygenase [Thermoleophilaceae bacterium]
MEKRDAVVVGARCAGSTLALSLAKKGWDVVMVDRDEFPSDTLSTLMIFPNTIARLDQLGILTTLHAAHNVPRLGFRIVGYGHESKGRFTPVDGHDGLIAPRRTALDKVLVDCALAAGVEGRFGTKVVDVIGSGTEGDPATGVVLEDGEEIHANWVFGADGRASKVAGKLGIEQTGQQSGEVSYLLAFWRGIPNDGYSTSAIREDAILSSWAAEDGQHLLTAWGDPDYTHGSKDVLLDRYLETLRSFPEILDPEVLENATMVSELFVAPESLMRGYFRKTNGPGWALVGDACHFKHPGTAQGIGDAIEQAIHVADGVTGGDPELAGYEAWRDARAAEHYDWSFAWGKFPNSPAAFKGWASEPDAGQDMRDSFSRQVKPSEVLSKERLARWFAPENQTVDA